MKIKVVEKESFKKGTVKEIEPILENFQASVGGYIEGIYVDDELERRHIICYVNDEGKINGQCKPNCWAFEKKDILFGTIVFVKGDDEGGDISLEEDDIEAIEKYIVKNQLNPIQAMLIREMIGE